MKDNPIGWFDLHVDDLTRAQAFYEKVFNVTLEKLEDPNQTGIEMLAFPYSHDGTGASGCLVKMEGVTAGGNSTVVYFSCEDCAHEEARVQEAGGRVQQSKFSIGEHGFISLIIDTEGNLIGLHSMV